MQATMTLHTSSNTLNMQANIKAKEIEEIIFNDFHHSNKTWSSLPTSPYTTTVAEGITTGIMSHASLYLYKQANVDEFQVLFDDASAVHNSSDNEIEDNSDIQTVPIPLFKRVHTLRVN